jgi:hypothetical protein
MKEDRREGGCKLPEVRKVVSLPIGSDGVRVCKSHAVVGSQGAITGKVRLKHE